MADDFSLRQRVATVLLIGALGCDDDDGTGSGGAETSAATTTTSATTQASTGAGDGGGGGTGGGGGAAPIDVTFYACPFVQGQNAECAKPELPLDWETPAGERIPYFVKRVPAVMQPARGQLWLLQGGPGASGTSIEFLATLVQSVLPDLDIYIPDHRGTGLSSKLVCDTLDAVPSSAVPLDPAEVTGPASACLADLQSEWGAGLAFFSATQAARDVGELIELTRAPGDEVYVFGVSYGTRWAHRYLQQFPGQANGVVFDSIVDETTDWWDFSAGTNAAAQQLFEACGADAFCSNKLGATPWNTLSTLMMNLAAGSCPTQANLTKDDYRALFANLFMAGWGNRSLLPALVYRANRCDPVDQQVILAVRSLMIQQADASATFFSSALHFNVVTGELASQPIPSIAEIDAAEDPLFVTGVQTQGYRSVIELWPAYPHDEYLGAYADTDTPILMMQSPIDGQTALPGASEFASHYTKPNQTYVVVDRATHGVITGAPTSSGVSCGLTLLGQFAANPTAPIDTSCTADVLPYDFENAGTNFGPGTLDAWENGSTLVETPGQVNALDLLKQRTWIGGGK